MSNELTIIGWRRWIAPGQAFLVSRHLYSCRNLTDIVFKRENDFQQVLGRVSIPSSLFDITIGSTQIFIQ